MKINYSLALEKTLAEISGCGVKKKLLLHSCCAPCSSYVLEYIAKYFDLTLFFYNPNISPRSEFDFRLSELERFSCEAGYNAKIISPDYIPSEFLRGSRGTKTFPRGESGVGYATSFGLRKPQRKLHTGDTTTSAPRSPSVRTKDPTG